MDIGLCNSTGSGLGASLPTQTLFDQSPCTMNNYSSCSQGWNDYCFQSGNYNTEECLNYYSANYENNQLNAKI